MREKYRRVWYLAVGMYALAGGLFYHKVSWTGVTIGSAFETLLAFLVIGMLGHMAYEFVLKDR